MSQLLIVLKYSVGHETPALELSEIGFGKTMAPQQGSEEVGLFRKRQSSRRIDRRSDVVNSSVDEYACRRLYDPRLVTVEPCGTISKMKFYFMRQSDG